MVDVDRVAALEAAIAAFPPADSAIRARLLSTLSLELTFSSDWERRLSLSDEATAMARRVGDPDALADVLMARCSATLTPDTLRQRLGDAAELCDLVPSVSDPARRLRSLLTGRRTVCLAGQVVKADTMLDAADDLAGDLRQPALQWVALLVRVGRTIIAGRLADADRLAAEAAEIGRLGGQREADWALGVHRLVIGTERGTIDAEFADGLLRAADDFIAAGGSLNLMDAAAALAAVQVGRTAEAHAVFDRLMRRSPSLDYFTILGESFLALLVLRLGQRAEAAAMYERLRPYPEWVIPTLAFPLPSVSFHLGLLAGFLGRFGEAEEHYTQAVTDHEGIGAPTFLARTRLEWARMLLTRRGTGDEARAHTLLVGASAAARDLGLLGVERDAAALLGRC
jgi:hypothetical protein